MDHREAVLLRYAERRELVVRSADVLSVGFSPGIIRRRTASGRWQRLAPGVLLLSSAPPTWRQRAWAACVWAGEDAWLSHRTAGHLLGIIRDAPDVIEITVPAHRHLTPYRGIRVYRSRLRHWMHMNPPHTALEPTVVDLVHTAVSEQEIVDIVTAGIRHRLHPEQLRGEARKRARLRNRRFLLDLVADVAGVESPLEYRYRRQVEHAHGLPDATRQSRMVVRGRWIRVDARYADHALRVELDGELAHPGRASHDDVSRDNDAILLTREITLRFRWHHVVSEPCATAQRVVDGLRLGGWQGVPTRCGPGCTVR